MRRYYPDPNTIAISREIPVFSDVMKNRSKLHRSGGFTLIETTIALVIIMIALLGVFYAVTYAINYNSGNSSRAEALALLQEEIELLRSAKFTPAFTDSTLTAGSHVKTGVAAANGVTFKVDDEITDVTGTLKEITITVTLEAPNPGWQTSVPATVILQRTRGN